MGTLLDRVNFPDDLKRLDLKELPRLAEEIRELIIDTISRTGGHLAASLGVVELTIALHYVFDTPADKLVWDVGHQTYAHKILTGRKECFSSIRQQGGISGFPKREESPFDTFGTGHSSTSISAALGMAETRFLAGEKHKVIAIIGDGSLMSGIAFEGLNHAGHLKRDLIVILNDNEMSISPNVGALSSYLSRLISGQAYNAVREDVKAILQRIPGIGQSMYRLAKYSEEFVKSIFVPGLIFEELGFKYMGPILGHRIDHLVDTFKNIKKLRGPILVHIITKKGKGYKPAETDPVSFHGLGPFEKDTGKPLVVNAAGPSYTKVFGDTLSRLARDDSRIIAITAGMIGGTGLDQFAREFPDRFYDVGIAEQHAITFAAGMSIDGYRPVVAIYSTFLQRAYDQIVHDVCLQNLPVVLMLDRAGIVGEDGPTHHGLFDISYLRHIPNMLLMAPKDENELQHMLYTAVHLSAPVAIRYPRGNGVNVPLDTCFKTLTVGKAEVIKHGSTAAILALGNTVYPACRAAELLQAEGISCAVVNSRFVKPLDEELICQMAQTIGTLITVEEHVLPGGFGSAVLEVLNHRQMQNVRVCCLGIPDTFVEHGTQKMLRAKYGIDAEGISATVKKIVNGDYTRCVQNRKSAFG
jgi:1-deoxy-D-xylulose-5-phosphate synthase